MAHNLYCPVLTGIDTKKPESYKVVIGWPSMFKVNPEERTQTIAVLISAVEADLLSWERAVELAAEMFGITDVQTLREELEKQKAEKEAKEAALAKNAQTGGGDPTDPNT